jgi:hypothetical protein
MLRLIFVAAVLWAASAVPSEAACVTTRYRFTWGNDATAGMQASSGQPCQLPLVAGGRSIIQGVKVASPPSNGSVSFQGHSAVYRSKPGFKGSDSFAVAVTGRTDVVAGTSTVRVSVTVQ